MGPRQRTTGDGPCKRDARADQDRDHRLLRDHVDAGLDPAALTLASSSTNTAMPNRYGERNSSVAPANGLPPSGACRAGPSCAASGRASRQRCTRQAAPADPPTSRADSNSSPGWPIGAASSTPTAAPPARLGWHLRPSVRTAASPGRRRRHRPARSTQQRSRSGRTPTARCRRRGRSRRHRGAARSMPRTRAGCCRRTRTPSTGSGSASPRSGGGEASSAAPANGAGTGAGAPGAACPHAASGARAMPAAARVAATMKSRRLCMVASSSACQGTRSCGSRG